MNIFFRSWLPVVAVAGLLGCSVNNAPSNSSNPMAQGQQIQLKLVGLESMSGQHYEGWALGPAGVTSTGRFNINEQNQIVSVNAAGETVAVLSDSDTAVFAIEDQALSLNAFVLTIEPDGDTDEGPSAIHYLEGDLTSGVGVVTVQNSGAIGVSFLQATGRYLLATPTNGPTTHNQGIWYVESGAPALDLPDLGANFTYEGWIVNTETGDVLSTGTFSKADAADSDQAGPAAGPNTDAAPPFPGQDYINPARILNDGHHVAVISVEPVPDFDPAPFAIKILRAEIANNAPVTTNFDLQNISNENELRIEVSIP